MKTCVKCLLPETHETIEFNNEGACNICIGQTVKKETINWVGQKAALDKLIERHRGKYDYDCIVPFSGGKDSTWTLYYLVNEYKLLKINSPDQKFIKRKLDVYEVIFE